MATEKEEQSKTRRPNRSGTLFLRGRVYYTKIAIGGKWVQKSTGTGDKDEARAILDKMTIGHDLDDDARLAAVETVLRRRVDPTAPQAASSIRLENAWDVFAARTGCGRSPATVLNDHGRWTVFCRWLWGRPAHGRHEAVPGVHPLAKTFADIDAGIASEFIGFVGDGHAPCTRNKYVVTMRRVWRASGFSAGGPWAEIKRKRYQGHLRRTLSPEELRKVLSCAKGETHTLFLIGTYTGLRLGDARRLDWRQVDLEHGAITHTPHKTSGTSGREVVLPIHPELLEALEAVAPERRRGLVTPTLAVAGKNEIMEVVRRVFADAGIETQVCVPGYRNAAVEVGFHSLRVTFVSMLGNAGTPLPLVQSMVGHMSPEMTMHYFRPDFKAARAAVAALPKV